ncbi:polysaccharide deacetylase family protein [Sporosarcina pasteurii]|uniref:Bifunctional xylanase/deacetylase n=1 Tax=Sporosarcina pasteurii TaxID=1474 RepID=A0A380C3K2_SPOPA|nr:polysaccharide deacetylase family protein [Sporosarcina pasteurii]MDS9471700.1 polysaccharide deacetylase family protein [Sporosarcina pasteurii]QBQ04699.1 1,4-beta-xylanase [Sporosarcina pasteurii]SUJ12158.1 Bifunctional xylanase/deacetylase precursor [Sporosarcina pasteurii]
MKSKKFRERFPLLDIILTCTTILLVLGYSYLLFIFQNNSTSATSKKDFGNTMPSTIDEIESNFSGIKIVTEISNDLSAPFAIQYPQSKHIQFNDEVKKYIKTIKYNYLTDIATYKKSQKEFTSELNISFETFEHNGIYSFVMVKNEYVGDNEGQINIQTFRLNPETGERITIENVFDFRLQHLKELSKHIEERLYEDETLINHLLPEQVAIHTEPVWENFQNFALAEDEIIFYFEYNKIANRDAGVPIVSIPYQTINSLLTESLQASFVNEMTEKPDTSQPVNGEHDAIEKEEIPTDKENVENKDVPKQKRVALTFDDGPDPKVTTRILDTLEKYDAKATFFMLGSRVEYYPEIAKSVYEAGHELGNHSWTHPDLTKAKNDKIQKEIDRTSTIIEEVTGQKPEIFRPPYGAFNDNVLNLTDLSMILWDVDTLDWKHRNASQLLSYVKQNTIDGSIILMHDIHTSTADGLDAVLAYLAENDYQFVTISELSE